MLTKKPDDRRKPESRLCKPLKCRQDAPGPCQTAEKGLTGVWYIVSGCENRKPIAHGAKRAPVGPTPAQRPHSRYQPASLLGQLPTPPNPRPKQGQGPAEDPAGGGSGPRHQVHGVRGARRGVEVKRIFLCSPHRGLEDNSSVAKWMQ